MGNTVLILPSTDYGRRESFDVVEGLLYLLRVTPPESLGYQILPQSLYQPLTDFLQGSKVWGWIFNEKVKVRPFSVGRNLKIGVGEMGISQVLSNCPRVLILPFLVVDVE